MRAAACGGIRALRRHRRVETLPGTVGLTVLGAAVPGSGYLYAGRRLLGAVVLLTWLACVGSVVWYFAGDLRGTVVDLAFDPTMLQVAAALLGLALLSWAFVVLTTYRLVRPRGRRRWHTAVGYAAVAVLVVVGSAPVVRAAQYALATADTVSTVFAADTRSPTVPRGATEDDPWAGQERVNVLLLGGDGSKTRTGVRTDTVILASTDTTSGRTVTFSLPRNMMYAQFPEDSPLHEVYPDGYRTGLGDPGFDMLNAVYSTVPRLHPEILGASDNEGADAVKQAVSGSLGIPVDYYVLVNLAGFKQIVDAVGGITVNINEPVAVNGNTDLGIPPTDYLEPGPDQHLDGFEALWFARGRYGSDDYERMERQRCAIDALIDAADPRTLLARYVDILRAGKELVYTDIPRSLGPDFVDLLLEVKDAEIRSVVFGTSDRFSSSDPDYEYVRAVVRKALDPPEQQSSDPSDRVRRGGGQTPPRQRDDGGNAGSDENIQQVENPANVCAYDPAGADDAFAAAD